ncbi:MAG: hypothetical protein JJV98_09430 [Desulfosarcina sp.]|nr:hypothetical protein [Desulfobacterales bacterium]
MGNPAGVGLTKVAGYGRMLCDAAAGYMMAHVIFLQVCDKDILPVGKPWITSDTEKVKRVPVAARAKS